MRTLHSRGHGTAVLASLIDPDTVRVGDSLTASAVAHRAELLVARRPSAAKDLLPVAVPRDLEVGSVRGVVAAVAGGPHSELAAHVASMVADALGVPAQMVCAYQEGTGREGAEETVTAIAELVPGLECRVVAGGLVPDLVAREGSRALLVLGAPGGSFLQRQFFGAGARLIAGAAVGAVVVHTAPTRVFQRMVEPEWVSLHLPAAEALRLHGVDPLPVVDGGFLVGIAHHRDLAQAGGAAVGAVMAPAVSLDATSLLLEAEQAFAAVDGGAVPVVFDGRLVGLLIPSTVGS